MPKKKTVVARSKCPPDDVRRLLAMTPTLGNRMMQIFFRMAPDGQQALVAVAEQLIPEGGGSEQHGEDVQPLRLVVGSKKGSK